MASPSTADIVFYAISGITLVGALGVALSRHILYAALSLMLSLAGVAALFVMLSADFVAGVQFLIYVGGVLVLTLFAVMLTQGIADVEISNRSVGRFGAGLVTTGFFALVSRAVLVAGWPSAPAEALPIPSSTAAMGDALLGPYVLPFELASVVLLAVLVGAVVLSRKEASE